jgi:CRP-like cAMP-binding protein
MANPKKRVVILGGGFGGVYVAVHLGKLLSKRELEEIEIVLVNRENYIVFQPLLPEVISGSVELNHVIAPIRRMALRANLFTRDVESIGRDGATLATLRDGDVFGEAALISDLPRNATIRAATSVDAVAVSREAFHELLRHLPGLSETMQNIMETRLERSVDLKQEMPSANVSAESKRGRGP